MPTTAVRQPADAVRRCVSRTPDQKVDLFPAALEASAPAGLYRFQPDPATADYPLALISPASDRTISSMLGELPRADVKLLMHPDDAAARGLADNDLVRVFNELGEVHCPLQVLPTIRPGTVSLPKGLWRRSTRNGSTGTALVPDTLTDLGGRRLLQRRARAGRLACRRLTRAVTVAGPNTHRRPLRALARGSMKDHGQENPDGADLARQTRRHR